jgi:hypothetical protein
VNRSSQARQWRNLAFLGVLGCATVGEEQPRTIEPPAPSSPSPNGAAAGNDGNSDFVLSRQGSGAAKTTEPQLLHIGDKWWRFRADFLKEREADVKDRDAAISERQAPSGFWDKQTATETVAIWGNLCNECHGGRRRLKDALEMPAPPEGWGRGDGLFFGNRRDYAAVFAILNWGGPERNGKRSPMPPWNGKLAREQMWSLLYFLEFQSGGIEGRFPPSLYPRPLEGK